jgi:hypothetical protein
MNEEELNMQQFTGKVAIITGSSRGIGTPSDVKLFTDQAKYDLKRRGHREQRTA